MHMESVAVTQFLSAFKAKWEAALGVWTVGVSYWDDIHICLRSLHYLSNTSAGDRKWHYGKQPTSNSSYIMWSRPQSSIIVCHCAATATTENIFATKKCTRMSFPGKTILGAPIHQWVHNLAAFVM